MDTEPHEPCDDYENTQKSVSEQSFILQEFSQNSGLASPGNSPDSGLNSYSDETMPITQIESLSESFSFKLRMLHDTGVIHSQYIHDPF